MKTLLVGLGNTILSDDGIGIRVVRELKEKIKFSVLDTCANFEFKELSISGLPLLDEITGCDKLIIIDSIKTGIWRTGEWRRVKIDDFSITPGLATSHALSLPEIIELGKKLGYKMPEVIDIYAIEVKDNTTFSETLTPELYENLPVIVETMLLDICNERIEN